jgi:hypothetical protein
MLPAIHDGQAVEVAPLNGAPTPGWCYVFIHQGNLLVHRLVSIEDTTLVFAGDSSRSMERVPKGSVIGYIPCEAITRPRALIAMINRALSDRKSRFAKLLRTWLISRIKIIWRM